MFQIKFKTLMLVKDISEYTWLWCR